jgi:hypothetical protein
LISVLLTVPARSRCRRLRPARKVLAPFRYRHGRHAPVLSEAFANHRSRPSQRPRALPFSKAYSSKRRAPEKSNCLIRNFDRAISCASSAEESALVGWDRGGRARGRKGSAAWSPGAADSGVPHMLGKLGVLASSMLGVPSGPLPKNLTVRSAGQRSPRFWEPVQFVSQAP